MIPKFQDATACFSCSRLYLINRNYPLAVGPLNYFTFQIISTFINEKIKMLPSVTSFTTQHPKVFTLIPSLTEGRAGIA
jgi:hypothetical protein